MASAVSTTSDSWVILPMGDLSSRSNTFWQLFHSAGGSRQWSLVTPPGVADNGGLVAGASKGTVVVGFLPSMRLRFSPLAQSSDGGSSWAPVFFPAGLAALPDALASQSGSPGGAVALTAGGRALVTPGSFSSWSPLASAAGLRRVSPDCAVTRLDAVALLPTGTPLVGTDCLRGGRVGVFTRAGRSWEFSGVTLGGSVSRSATAVLRLEATGSTITALVAAARSGHRSLVALWRTGVAPWTASTPLAISSAASVLSTSVGASGGLDVLLGSPGGRPVAFAIAPGGRWSHLPQLPSGTAALAAPGGTLAGSSGAVDAFTVDGESLGVFTLTPSGTAWVRVQSTQVPIAYGSSG
jgi:hypothetical protein